MTSRCRSSGPRGARRETWKISRYYIIIIFIISAAVFCASAPAQAGVTGVTCSVTAPDDLGKTYNAGQKITLHAAWTGDTPPFGATFKTGGSAIGTVNTSEAQADFTLSAAALGEGDNNFTVSVIETAVPNSAGSPDAPANRAVKIDRTAPVLTLSVVSGMVASPQAGYNEVVVQVTSGEALGEAPKFTISPGTWGSPAPETPETAPYTNGRYKITVPAGTMPGVYTVRVSGKDATEPAASRNEGSAQTAFTVDAAADGTVAINTSVPVSPSRSESLTLQGTVPAESQPQKVEVLEGSTVVGTAHLAAGADTWSVALAPVAEGSHQYTARRIDPLGNVSGPGAPFTVVVDRTPPGRPVIDPPKTPVNTTHVRITGRGATDAPHDSGPVKITLRRENTVIGSGTANADGTFTIDNVKLEPGSDLILAQAADTTRDSSGSSAGNTSEFSAAVTVVLDQTAPVVLPGGVVVSSPAPAVAPTVPSDIALMRANVPDVPPGDVAPSRFIPPLSGDGADTRLILPLAAISDRSPERVSVWLLYRRFDDPPTTSHQCALTLGGRGFETSLPAPGAGLYYRFQLVDPAGNVSWLPAAGEFCHLPIRSEVLQCVEHARTRECPADADEWPISALGPPPRERLAAYRTVEAPAALLPAIAALIDALPEPMKPCLTLPADGVPDADDASWRTDLERVKAGKTDELPASRADLLVRDILAGNIPDDILPSPEDVSGSGAAERIAEAIRFRRLHGPATGE